MLDSTVTGTSGASTPAVGFAYGQVYLVRFIWSGLFGQVILRPYGTKYHGIYLFIVVLYSSASS